MKELCLVHPIRGYKNMNIGSLKEAPDQGWERLPNGNYLIWAGEFEYELPSTSVKFEKRPRTKREAKK